MIKSLFQRMFKRHTTIGQLRIRRDLRPDREDVHGTIQIPSSIKRELLIRVPFYVDDPKALVDMTEAELAVELNLRLRAVGINPEDVGSIHIPTKPGFNEKALLIHATL